MSDRLDWSRVTDLFHRALDQPPDAREAFIREASEGDAALRAEVLSLLASHDRAGDFIEMTAAAPRDLLQLAFETSAPLVGQTVGQYRVTRVLGEGGMGVVYLADDTRLGRAVALKALSPRLTRDQAGRERLRREARAAAALSHPGIATVYALEEFGDDLFIASEYVPGETLRDEINRGPLAPTAAIDTAVLMARALAAAHDRGVIHRDLKPENVIRMPSRDVKILDFGLARLMEGDQPLARLTLEGAVLGTPAYMSPEQIRSEPIDARSDIFSLGVVLYEMLSGVSPFAGADAAATLAKVLESPPVPLAAAMGPRRPAGLAALDRVVAICLSKTPDGRYPSAHALAQSLEEARGELTTRATTPAPHARETVSTPQATSHPMWWWQFHQAAASVVYAALLGPLWKVHDWREGVSGLLLFLAGLVAVIVASTLRLHLWFTVRSYPAEWAPQRRSTGPWIFAADAAFALVLLIGAALVLTLHASVGVLFVGAAVAVMLSATVIEPATTRAAFGTDREMP